MLKKLTNVVKTNVKLAAENTINNITSKTEGKINSITDFIDIQNYVYEVISRMDEGADFWDWSSGYWNQHDTEKRIEPLSDRKAYMRKGKSFKRGKVYKVGPMFKGEYSLGADIGELGTVYNLDYLNKPAQYAVAKDKTKVMLFNWIK